MSRASSTFRRPVILTSRTSVISLARLSTRRRSASTPAPCTTPVTRRWYGSRARAVATGSVMSTATYSACDPAASASERVRRISRPASTRRRSLSTSGGVGRPPEAARARAAAVRRSMSSTPTAHGGSGSRRDLPSRMSPGWWARARPTAQAAVMPRPPPVTTRRSSAPGSCPAVPAGRGSGPWRSSWSVRPIVRRTPAASHPTSWRSVSASRSSRTSSLAARSGASRASRSTILAKRAGCSSAAVRTRPARPPRAAPARSVPV